MRKRGTPRPLIFVMARLPVAGAVKTRLARNVGTSEAIRIYRVLLSATLRALRLDPRWQVCLAITPARTRHHRLWRRLAPGCKIVAQAQGDLGTKMAQLLRYAGPAPAAVIGSDILDLRANHIGAALQALKGGDAVLAPAEDGGFWLCAVRGIRPDFALVGAGPFSALPWSQADTGLRTKRALEARGLRVCLGPTRRDIDDKLII